MEAAPRAISSLFSSHCWHLHGDLWLNSFLVRPSKHHICFLDPWLKRLHDQQQLAQDFFPIPLTTLFLDSYFFLLHLRVAFIINLPYWPTVFFSNASVCPQYQSKYCSLRMLENLLFGFQFSGSVSRYNKHYFFLPKYLAQFISKDKLPVGSGGTHL